MKKPLFTFLLVLLSSCATIPQKGLDIKPEGELFAYFRITQHSYSEPIERANGYYFYKENPKDIRGPILYIYEYINGEIVDYRGGGSDSAEVFTDIESIGFVPFDYKKEIEFAEEERKKGSDDFGWITMDGNEWEIMIDTNQGKFLLKKWNPGTDFKNYKKYSENIQKLEKVIKRLLLFYADSIIHIL